ncbi:DUF4833 domain-containing protein [Mangrovimonas futianensis]|uniref:DUF4833 domain-containing protein n=1 Tax=Mangrovimonas futianensis TaxID=2895523 RepID=UPI001E4476E5|nr:DUF4833 domain-containing protein [Mangrovimonas futianensis]MCF1421921.1 DUF4833 domain-containing protein [Mangrovimonas futianensis]
MVRYLKVIVMGCFLVFHVIALGQENYPIPKRTPHRLFYIQHSYNHNTYVYDANLDGSYFKKNNPVNEYRIVYTEGGVKKPLSPIQKKMAYGTHVQFVKTNLYRFTLAASKELVFFLIMTSKGIPRVFVNVNGRKIYLDRMFLELDDSLTSLSVQAKYILLEGTDYTTGENVVEKVTMK